MKTLLILRHAKSSWKDPDLADHDRPLNKRGKKDAPEMGKLIKKQKLKPDRIISATALRARKTADEAAKVMDVVERVNAGLPDAGIFNTQENRRTVVELIRKSRPTTVR